MPVCCDPSLFKANIAYCVQTDYSEEDKIRCTMNRDIADRIDSMVGLSLIKVYTLRRK